MATSVKYQNISVQPTTVPRTARTVYELPRQNLTEAELSKKSTSDRTKRRVAHRAWFPLPVITKPVVVEKPPRKQIKKLMFKKDGTVSCVTIFERRKSTSNSTKRRVAHEPEVTKTAAEKAQQKQIKKPVLNKDGTVSRVTTFEGRKSTADSTKRSLSHVPEVTKPAAVVAGKTQKKQIKKVVSKKDESTWSVKPREVKQTTQRVVVDPARAEHSRSSSSGIERVDDRVKADKRGSGGLGVEEIFLKKQKKVNVDNLKNKDVTLKKKSLLHKGVDDRVTAYKKKSEGLGVDGVFVKKQKKGVDERVKAEKRVSEGLSFDEVLIKKLKKGVDDRVKPDKIKSGGLGVFTFF